MSVSRDLERKTTTAGVIGLVVSTCLFSYAGFLLGTSDGQDVTGGRPQPLAMVAGTNVEARFSPRGGCEEEVLRAIRSARRQILVATYQLTNQKIRDALADAKKRGVDVRVVVDETQENAAHFLKEAGVDVWVDRQHAIFHNKFIIVDGEVLLTGSYNFSRAAESRNAENLITIRNERKVVEGFVENWKEHQSHSEKQ